ncbi:MAG: glutamine-hydrolyzing GMP synthase [Clostridia bacterium]
MENQTILILDFGGQYKELIARSIREMNIYAVVKSGSINSEEVKQINPIGIILTGGPNSVYGDSALDFDSQIFNLGVPVLGICYGMQLMCHTLGGVVGSCNVSEFGVVSATLNTTSVLFNNVSTTTKVLMSHSDRVYKVPKGFNVLGKTSRCPICAMGNNDKKLFGIQFHPEVELSKEGATVLRNFAINICNASCDYNIDDYIQTQIEKVRKQVGDSTVILGLSGGVDSSVCATLLSRAIGKQLVCIFVDHGLMRYKEGDEIEQVFSKMDLKFIRVNAEERFLSKLAGVVDPETKRKIVGKEFVEVFKDEAKKYPNARFLAQGTIYPDIIESGGKHNAVIKSHHNVGGLPKELGFDGVVEPLNGLFKNEVRLMGKKLGLPDFLIQRQPFPGPGLSIRIIGDVTKEKCDILRLADFIYREEVVKSKIDVSQYFAVLTGVRTVGVMGDYRTYDYLIALRAVKTSDFMTCDYVALPHKLLKRISTRIVDEVKGVNRIVYDITSKPPATVEWE